MMAEESILPHERERYCRTNGSVFTLNSIERQLGEFHLQYSSKRGRYERGDKSNEFPNVEGWEAGAFYHKGIDVNRNVEQNGHVPGSTNEVTSLIAWKFDFGAYRVNTGKIKCLTHPSLKWRLFTRKDGDGYPWQSEITGTHHLTDVRGTSFLILTAIFPNHLPNQDLPDVLKEGYNACHLFKISVNLERHQQQVDKGNDLSAAAMSNDVDRIDGILQAEYRQDDLKAWNSEGDTALHVAFKCRSNDMGIHLIQKYPELKHIENKHNEKPWTYASKKMKRLVENYQYEDTEDEHKQYNEKRCVGYDLRNDRDIGKDAIGHDTYAKGLANALFSPRLPTPLTVGIFGPWGSGKTFLLKRLKQTMRGMARGYRISRAKLWSEFKLLLRIIFFLPPPPTMHYDTNEMDFVFVNFEAWQFAGCDKLWAGIVTNLVSRVERYAGYWKTRFFRIVVKQRELTWRKTKDKDKKLKPRKTIGIPNFAWAVFILIILIVGIVLAVLIGTGELIISDSSANATNSTTGEDEGALKKGLVAIEGAIATVLGGAVIINIKNVGNGVMTFSRSQKSKIEGMVNKPDIQGKLGFMAGVKKEVLIAARLISWISRYREVPIRIVISVDDLDRVDRKKAVEVIEAITVLLSDENSPFICILAVDPRIISEAIEDSLGNISKNAYVTGQEYLKKFIQVTFCIPPMTTRSKQKFLEHLKVEARTRLADENLSDDNDDDDDDDDDNSDGEKTKGKSSQKSSDRDVRPFTCWSGNKSEDLTEVIVDCDMYMEDLLKEFRDLSILHYMQGNPRTIKRIFNLLCLTAHMVKVSGGPKFLPRDMVLWTVLVDQWPYRTNQMIHCIEDNIQRQELGIQAEKITQSLKLKEVLKLVKDRLQKPKDWQMLMALDKDPEMLVRFLSTEMKHFEVRDALQIVRHTPHLDRSIMFSIAHAEAIHTCT
ncbi:NTPase KAP family P-loop domain-containing protein 1-like [Glandiceps talaboti]